MKDDAFADRVAVVTAGGSGIGRALAHELAARGARVAVTDVDAGRLDAVVQELRDKGARVRGDRVDHTSLREVQAYRELLRSEWGPADVLCANVGVGYTAALADMSVADWERVMSTNFWSAVYVVQLFAPEMIERRRGRILLTASLAGLVGLPTASAYCASKFALVGLGEALRAELGRHRIGVTVLCPGMVRTNFSKDGRFSFGDLPFAGERLDRLWQRFGEDPAVVARKALRALQRGDGMVPSSFPLVTVPFLAKRIGGDLVGAGLARGWSGLAGRPRPRGAPVGLRDLRRMTGPQLDALYASAATPSPEELDGPYDGVLLRWTLAPAMRALDVVAPGHLPWQGKVFFAGGGPRGGANRFAVGPREHHVWPFQTKVVDSRFGGEPALAIDYDLPGNPKWLRRGVFDELKKVGDDLFLGKGGLRLGGGRALVFSWAVSSAARR